jgi:Cullin family
MSLILPLPESMGSGCRCTLNTQCLLVEFSLGLSFYLCQHFIKDVSLLTMPSIKTISKDNDVDFDSSWNVLANALHEIHTKNASQLSFEELYRNAYKLVLKKKAEMLYDRVSQFEEAWLRDQVRARITNLITPSISGGGVGQAEDRQSNERRIAGDRFMKALKDSFEDHQLCMCMITDVLMYMVSSHSPTCIF